MSPTTASRRRVLRQLIDERPIGSQQELVDLLSDSGHEVTQATVSRDLDAMGAVKAKVGESFVYVIEDDRYAFSSEERAAGRALADFVESIAVSGNLVVLRTPPGAAQLVASSIDGAALEGVLGTVAGDDTLLIVASEEVGGTRLAVRLEQMGAG